MQTAKRIVGIDLASGPDIEAWYWRMPQGYYILKPDYIPVEWMSRITPEYGPDRNGVCRWHLLWTGWNNGEGHGKFKRAGRAAYCYREVVEKVTGRLLTRDQHVDHICERKPCLTFECLEVVSPGENVARGPGADNQFKPTGQYVAELAKTYGDPLDALE